MLIAAHSIVGGVVGEAIGHPIAALLLGFILHFVLDAIPHFDTTDGGKLTKRQLIFIGVDGSLGLVIIIYLLLGHSIDPVSFIAGSFGSLIPDLLDNVKFWEKKFRVSKYGSKFHAFHGSMEIIRLGWKHWKLGVFTQVLVVLISIVIYLKFIV